MLELLDFYADWCGPCGAMVPIFEDLEKEFQGKITFKRIDVEVEGELTGKYSVTAIPTFVLIKDGKEVDRKSGAMPKEVLRNWLTSKL